MRQEVWTKDVPQTFDRKREACLMRVFRSIIGVTQQGPEF